LFQADYIKSLQYFHSPLEDTVMLGELDASQCKVMNAGKKPIWLVWKNPDELADKRNKEFSAIIYKNGDDLQHNIC
jgi:phosphatidylinositol-4,5-bisphosphate 3-kinase